MGCDGFLPSQATYCRVCRDELTNGNCECCNIRLGRNCTRRCRVCGVRLCQVCEPSHNCSPTSSSDHGNAREGESDGGDEDGGGGGSRGVHHNDVAETLPTLDAAGATDPSERAAHQRETADSRGNAGLENRDVMEIDAMEELDEGDV